MKFQTRITVVGMKGSKGTLESGQAYDSCKVYALVSMDESKGTQRGQSAAEYAYGDASEFDRFKTQAFPFEADAEMEMVTNGRTTKTVLRALNPVKAPRA